MGIKPMMEAIELAELQALCGPDGPVAAAWDFLRTDLQTAPTLTDAAIWDELPRIHEFLDGFDVDSLGAGTEPRPVTVDHELVPFFDLGFAPIDSSPNEVREDTTADFALLMHLTPEGWRVAGFERP